MSREGLELSSGISPIAVHRPRQPAALPSARIRTSVNPELVGATPPLSRMEPLAASIATACP